MDIRRYASAGRNLLLGSVLLSAPLWPGATTIQAATAPVGVLAPSTSRCDAQSDLTADLSVSGRRVTITNLSTECSYDVGIAAYQMVDFRLRTQLIFDSETTSIEPGAAVTLMIKLPDCAAQVDVFAGPVVMSFESDGYWGRLLAGRWINLRSGFCDASSS